MIRWGLTIVFEFVVQGDYVLAPLIVFYDAPMNGWLAILFMWACVFVGFTFASFARSFLVEDPKIIFPLTLQRVSVCGFSISLLVLSPFL